MLHSQIHIGDLGMKKLCLAQFASSREDFRLSMGFGGVKMGGSLDYRYTRIHKIKCKGIITRVHCI